MLNNNTLINIGCVFICIGALGICGGQFVSTKVEAYGFALFIVSVALTLRVCYKSDLQLR